MNLVGRYLPGPSQVTGSLLNVATQPLGRVGVQSMALQWGICHVGLKVRRESGAGEVTGNWL